MSLALHTASPGIEAYYQYYRDHKLEGTPLANGENVSDCTGSWILWNNTKVCSARTLSSILSADLELTGYVSILK